MKKIGLLLTFLICITLTQAQQNDSTYYIQDTIKLKSGLIMPCKIIHEKGSNQFIYVEFLNHSGQLTETRFDRSIIEQTNDESLGFGIDSTSLKIEFKDGTILTGELLSETDTHIELKLEGIGVLIIKRENIKSIIILDEKRRVEKAYWFENPHATRLLFAPTAIPLKKGEGYYQNIYIVANMFNYGLMDNLSIGGGFDFITMFAMPDGNWNPLINLNIKSGFQISENFHAAVGAMYLGMMNEFSAGIIYGAGTYGSYNTNATLGLGWGFVDGTFQEKPFIMIGGMARVTEKLWLVSENWIVPTPEYYLVVSYGVRFAAKRIAVDLAFINSKDIFEEIFIGIPFVDFVIKLGK